MIALPPRNVVHLWHVNLDCDVSELQRLEKLLSRDEEARAARLHFARQRNLFVAARGMLRELLACYINVPAAQIRFAYGAWGKPSLEKHPSLCFNLAHCGTRALVVVAHECEVGVDIERVRTDLLTPALIDLAFCEAEKRILRQLERAAQGEAFFRLWTCKEAYIKADGRGVSLPLTQINVSDPDGHITTLNGETGTWQVCPQRIHQVLDLGHGYTGAVAAAGLDWKLEVMNSP
jgi:4'-phosphopantetheinyl transferase